MIAVLEASIIIETKNRAELLQKTLKAILSLKHSTYEIIVLNNGSTDGTAELLKQFSKNPKIKALNFKESHGPAFARNRGIEVSKGKFIVIMDDDCIPSREWLSELLKPFNKGKKVGITSSFNDWGGTSTAYRRELLEKIGFFDEDFPTSYREDTDTVFKIFDLGYSLERNPKAEFKHEHKQPKSFFEKLKYGWSRIKVHSVDPLLYKKHPVRTREFLDIKLGFVRNPLRDFEAATGLWWKRNPRLVLSSPQGVPLIENKSALHAFLIVLIGIAYVFWVKIARFYGSIKYGKLLV